MAEGILSSLFTSPEELRDQSRQQNQAEQFQIAQVDPMASVFATRGTRRANLFDDISRATGFAPPAERKALELQKIQDEVRKSGLSLVKNKEEFLTAVLKGMESSPEAGLFGTENLVISQIIDEEKAKRSAAQLEQAKLGIKAFEADTKRLEATQPKTEAERLIARLPKGAQAEAFVQRLNTLLGLDKRGSFEKELDSAVRQGIITSDQKAGFLRSFFDKKSKRASDSGFTVSFDENGNPIVSFGTGAGLSKVPGGKANELALRADAIDRGTKIIDEILESTNALGSVGFVNRIVSETTGGLADLAKAIPGVSSVIEKAKDMVQTFGIEGEGAPSVSNVKNFNEGGKVSAVTIPTFENALAILLSQARHPEGRILAVNLKDAKESINLQGLLKDPDAAKERLLAVRREFQEISRDIRARTNRTSGTNVADPLRGAQIPQRVPVRSLSIPQRLQALSDATKRNITLNRVQQLAREQGVPVIDIIEQLEKETGEEQQ